jgi:hypothetical protein
MRQRALDVFGVEQLWNGSTGELAPRAGATESKWWRPYDRMIEEEFLPRRTGS